MKNWNYIEGAKVGNSLGTDIYQHKLDPNQYMVVDWDKQTVTIIVNGHVRDVIKNLNNLSYALHLYKKVNVMNTKSGNDTPWEYAHRKPKVINEDKTGAEEFFKKLSDDVKEREKKDDADIEKVGNKVVWKEGPYRIEEVEKDGKFGFYNISKGSFNAYRNSVLYGNFKTLESAKAKMNEEIRMDKEYNRKYTTNSKTGNFKTGTSQLKPGDKVMSFGKKGTVKEVIGENTDNIYGEPLIKVEFEDGTTKTIGEHYMRKVGNARYTTREDVISHLDTDLYDICKKVPAGSPSFAYVSELQKKGWDISTISKYTKEIGKIIDQYKVGNSKVGNSAYDDGAKKGKEDKRKGKQITAAGFEYHAPGYSSLSFKEKEEYRKGYYSTNDLKKEDIYKWGNSAQDDKFAYVMREFDEGKLKTPDGKVVTDPAQAKAIAYSESKKTENGLARARKAMNAWNSERKIEPVGKYREFIDNLKNAIELGVAGVLYNSLDEQTVKEWVEKAKKEGYGSHISGVQGKKVILK